MNSDELFNLLGSLNSSWKNEFINSNKELIDELYLIERKLSIYEKELLDEPKKNKIMELKGSKIKILEIIVDSFKSSTDMKKIPVSKKKFLYKNKIDIA